MGEPSGIPCGWLTVNSPRTSTGWVPSVVSISTGLAVGVLQEQLPVVRGLGLVPVHVDLQRHGGGHGVGARHAPAAAQNEELAVGHLGRVAQQHGHFHEGGGYRSPSERGIGGPDPTGPRTSAGLAMAP